MLKKLLASKYFPTLSKPLLAGLVGSAVVYGLHALGITDFTSNEVNAAVAPLVGFLITAVVSKPNQSGGDTPEPVPPSNLTAVLGDLVKLEVQDALASDPQLVKQLTSSLLENVLYPKQIVQLPTPPAAPGVEHLPQT